MRYRDVKYKVITALWPLGNLGKRMARLPVLDRLMGPRLWNERSVDATYIPVCEPVEVPPGNVVPFDILGELAGTASKRFIMDECICRTALKCKAYPRDFGCLFLGDAAGDIDPSLGREATLEEAITHIEKARDLGLLPCVVHAWFDASLLDIEYEKMLAVCFCCDCCCTIRTEMRGGPAAYRDRIIRLPGLVMDTLGDCAHCGACEEACFLGAISQGPGGPVFAEFCKACGRCASVCPRGNIRLRLEPGVDSMGILMDRIGARTDIT